MSNAAGLRKAVVLVSGGLDSATALYFAKKKGFSCHCLVFDYGQRHVREINAARNVARRAGCPVTILKISLPWKGSSLIDRRRPIPGAAQPQGRVVRAIPDTYVPARNIIFLSFALSYAEAIGARAIFIGANSIDYSGYPDCRPRFYRAFGAVIAQGTRAGVEKKSIKVYTPLLELTKEQIIKLGTLLGVPYELTWSCYKGGGKPCGVCDSCRLRAKGFRQAGMEDPSLR
ncbi:MAG: 7-cyano-7-deazaguanine synthase QueC [Candidatus Omnitrophica bacterium]|nr:7-cyano-7-deazaguanine synthase QueC [Candidatus Omnitrophota bacterium]